MTIIWIIILAVVIYVIVGLLTSKKIAILRYKERSIYQKEIVRKRDNELTVSNNVTNYYDAYIFML